MFRSFFAVLTCVLSLAPLSAVQASWQEAMNTVDQTSAQMMQVMENPELNNADQLDPLMLEIEQVLRPVVDFSYISKRVMGKYYRKASSEQQQAFRDVFRDTLIRTYAKSLSGFEITHYEMAPEGKPSPKPNKQIVSVYIYSSSGQKYTLVYYMLKQDDGWKLVNVLVDGINLRLNFKNQFADMVSRSRGDVGKVISDWKALVSTDTGVEKEGA